MVRIAIVDDQHLFRQGLCALIANIDRFELVAEAGDAKALLFLLEQLPVLPDVLLTDLNMPGLNGVDLNDILQKRFPSIKVIVLTVHNQPRYIRKMTEAGASGYLLKDCTAEELSLAIDSVYRAGFYFNAVVMKALQLSLRQKGSGMANINHIPIELTDRELDVLQLICQEFTNPEVAEKLFLSVRTVEGHRNSLLQKTGCRNAAGLVIFAIRYNIFDVGF